MMLKVQVPETTPGQWVLVEGDCHGSQTTLLEVFCEVRPGHRGEWVNETYHKCPLSTEDLLANLLEVSNIPFPCVEVY